MQGLDGLLSCSVAVAIPMVDERVVGGMLA